MWLAEEVAVTWYSLAVEYVQCYWQAYTLGVLTAVLIGYYKDSHDGGKKRYNRRQDTDEVDDFYIV